MRPALSRDELAALRTRVGAVRVDDSLRDYLLDLVDATRSHPDLVQGASTRGALTFDTAARAAAVLAGRDYVIPDDLKGLAVPVLAHRLGVRGTMREGRREKARAIVRQILAEAPVPG